MIESLESARNIHQILIVVCTIILIFALSIIPKTNFYRLALADLKTAEDTLIDLIKRDKIRIASDSVLVIYGEKYINSSKIEDEHIKAINDLNKAVRINNSRQRELHNLSQENLSKASQIIKMVSVERDSAVKKGIRHSVEKLDLELKQAQAVYAEALKASKRNFRLGKTKAAYKRQTNLPPSQRYDPSKLKLIDLYSLSEFFMDTILFDQLVKDYPSFRYFGRANENKSISEIKELLHSEELNFEKNPNQEVDLSGFKVASENMYIVAPIISLALLIYLLTLVLHINSTLQLAEDAETAASFPWLGLFENRISKFLTTFTVFFYPWITSIILLNYSEINMNEKNKWEIVYSILFIGTGWYLSHSIEKLQKRVHTRPFV